MFISPSNSKRFNLYHLQQKQIYIQDFYGRCSFYDLSTNQQKDDQKGKFYLCSKSIIFEPDNRNTPLMKYRYQSFKDLPKFNQQSFKFVISRITMVKASTNSPPQPFKVKQDLKQIIQIKPTYQKVKNLQQWIIFLYHTIREKNNYDMQQKIYQMIVQKFNKKAFNMSLIQSVSQKPAIQQHNILAKRVLPLNHIYGYIFITNQKVYFQPLNNISAQSVHKIQIEKITKLFKRRYQLRNIGLQIITDKVSYYLTFDNQRHRNNIFQTLSKLSPPSTIKLSSLQALTFQWQTGQLSNYQYLMHLNMIGNRSTMDLSQYPIFPWIITDYDSQQIDLNDQSIYRDLSKPIGALNPQRLQVYLQRYQYMDQPKFMYGTHYSTPGYVIGYLLRKKPQYMIKLQSGRFDKPDRLFKSIKGDWQNVYCNNASVKQLIPQFYQDDSSFLRNYQNLDLGVCQGPQKLRVNDVQLPKWAKGNFDYFLQINRRALQSQYVSQNLHKWIDLIFGCKQRGQQAIKANNLFYYTTYQGIIDLDKIQDPIQRISMRDQINQFGQCPKQIFIIPHPSRSSRAIQKHLSFKQDQQQQSQKSPQMKKQIQSNVPSKITTSSSLYASNGQPKVKTVLSMGKQTDIKYYQINKAHKSQITSMIHLQNKPNTILTIGQDGFLKIFDVVQKICTKSFKISDAMLSSIVVLKKDQIFAIGSWDNNIYLFNIQYGTRSKPFSAHDNSISSLVYLKKSKRIISGSWDCSVKSFRYVGNIIDQQQMIWDHQNQVSSIAVNSDQQILVIGDIQGNVVGINLQQKEQIFNINMNGQRINKVLFIQNNIIVAAETQMRIIDIGGSILGSYYVDKTNGKITNISVDGEHLYILTTNKQLVVFDLLQRKKIGNFFNDFTISPKDKLPQQKQLTCIVTGNQGLYVTLGGGSGNIFVLRS